MPLYYFDVHNSNIMQDAIGDELPDDEAARIEAYRTLPQIVADTMRWEQNDRHQFAIVVRNEDGRGVYAVTLSVTGVKL